MDAVIYKKLNDTLNSDTDGNLKISVSNVDSVTTVHHDNVSLTGNRIDGEIANINGMRCVAIQTFGSADTINIIPYISIDGQHWKQVGIFSHYASDGGSSYGMYLEIAGWKYLKCVIEEFTASSTAGNLTVISNAIY